MRDAVQERVKKHLEMLRQGGASAAPPQWTKAAAEAMEKAGLDPGDQGAWRTLTGALMAGVFPGRREPAWRPELDCELLRDYVDLCGRDRNARNLIEDAFVLLAAMPKWKNARPGGYAWGTLKKYCQRAIENRASNPALLELIASDQRVADRVADFIEESAKRKKQKPAGSDWPYRRRKKAKSKLRTKVKRRKVTKARKSRPKIRPARRRQRKAKSRGRR